MVMGERRAARSTQERFPWRAAVRTGLQVAAGIVLVALVAIPLALEVFGPWLSPAVAGWLAGAAALLTAVATFVSRLMAAAPVIAFVERWLPWAAPDDEGR